MSRSVTACFLAAWMTLASATDGMAEQTAGTAERAVNLSAMQGMLVEQMAKSTCYATLGRHTRANVAYLEGALAQFRKVKAGLRSGDDALDLSPETNVHMLRVLDRAADLTGRLTGAMTAMARSADFRASTMELVAHQVPSAVEAVDDYADRIQSRYGEAGDIPLALGLRISLAARQRMLSQRMSKEYCLIALGVDPEANRERLAGTVELFDRTAGALLDGFEMLGLPAETHPERRARLETVARLWAEVKPAYRRAVAGEAAEPGDLELVEWQDKVILAQMNKAVFAYEKGAGS